GREPLHRRGDPRFDFLADKCAFGIQRRAVLTLALEEISDAFLVNSRIQLRRLVFGAGLAAAQVVQANVGNDAVEPGVKAALKAESVEIAVDLKEGFLIYVPGVLGPLDPVERQAQTVRV